MDNISWNVTTLSSTVSSHTTSLGGWRFYTGLNSLGLTNPNNCTIEQILNKMQLKSILHTYVNTEVTNLPSSQLILTILLFDNRKTTAFIRGVSIWSGLFYIAHMDATNTVKGWKLFNNDTNIVVT